MGPGRRSEEEGMCSVEEGMCSAEEGILAAGKAAGRKMLAALQSSTMGPQGLHINIHSCDASMDLC